MKSRLGILQSNAKSENGFHGQEIRPQCGFQLKISKSGFRGFPYLPFEWEIRKQICKTVPVNSGIFFLLIMRARARPPSLRTVLQMLFRIYPTPPKKNRRKGYRFRIWRSTSNPKSTIQNLDPDFPIEHNLSKLQFRKRLSSGSTFTPKWLKDICVFLLRER